MDGLHMHEISEAGHRILNPFTDDKLLLLGEICRLQPGHQQLDLACGKGEMVCRWAQRFGIGGLGVDISEVFVPAARARAVELGVDERVRFEHADASTFRAEDDAYDVVSCIGATWIGDGVAGTIELMRPSLRPDGLLLIGEPYWRAEPPEDVQAALGFGTEEFVSLSATADRFDAAGAELVEMVLADGDSWDRYAAGQWWTIERWLRDHPDHADTPAMRQHLTESRASYLAHQRCYLGWGVFVLRLR